MVLLYWPANAGAELVPLNLVMDPLREKVSGVQSAIAQKFKNTAVNLVCSRFTDHVDYAAHGISILGAQVAVLHAELLDRVRVGKWQVRIDVSVVVSHAVQLVIHALGKRAVGFRILLARIRAAFAVCAAIVFGSVRNSCRQEDQRLNLTPATVA